MTLQLPWISVLPAYIEEALRFGDMLLGKPDRYTLAKGHQRPKCLHFYNSIFQSQNESEG